MENVKTFPQLEKHSGTYKLVIPREVERKIRHLCGKISAVEWSGTLFYTYNGSYEDNNLEIRCVDIFPMDIGSASYTEFDMSPDVIAYMTEHPELLDCQMGLIHSHATLNTFFSGTDAKTLQEEGNDRNHFVSLIVNNAGTYTAAITRKLKVRTISKKTYTYKSFDDEEKSGERAVETEEEVIAYNYLDIVKEGEPSLSFQEIDERLDLIKKNKEATKAKTPPNTSFYSPKNFTNYWRKDYKDYGYNSLFDEEYMESSPITSYTPPKKENSSDVTISAPLVKSLVMQLITGSVALSNPGKLDLEKWAEQMIPLFDKRFKDMNSFNSYIEMFVEFILCDAIPEEYAKTEVEYAAELSKAMYLTLDKLPSNKYIDAIKEILEIWIQ